MLHRLPQVRFHRITTHTTRQRENSAEDNIRRDSIRQRLMQENAELLGPRPPGLPPSRVVDHAIPLIDDNKRYNYYLSKCPDALRPQLLDKINTYIANGWWEPCQTDQAAPLLCIPKKTGDLRAVCDLRQRNDNTVKEEEDAGAGTSLAAGTPLSDGTTEAGISLSTMSAYPHSYPSAAVHPHKTGQYHRRP